MVRNLGKASEEAIGDINAGNSFPPPRPKMISLKGIRGG